MTVLLVRIAYCTLVSYGMNGMMDRGHLCDERLCAVFDLVVRVEELDMPSDQGVGVVRPGWAWEGGMSVRSRCREEEVGDLPELGLERGDLLLELCDPGVDGWGGHVVILGGWFSMVRQR